VTTEALPKPDTHAEMRFYWDSSHFKEIVGDFVLDRVFGVNYPQRRVPPDFGVQLKLNPATIEPTLARVRADQLAYRRRNPDDASWIRSLVGPHRARPPFPRRRRGLTTLAGDFMTATGLVECYAVSERGVPSPVGFFFLLRAHASNASPRKGAQADSEAGE
jgi:hypothetical protein